MKIIDVAEHYSSHGGGVKTYIHSKIKEATKTGHQMIVIAPGYNDSTENIHGGKIIWIKSRRLIVDRRYGVFSNPNRIHDILDREQPDIVEAGSIGAAARIVGSWKGNAIKALIFHQDFVAVYGHTFLDKYIHRDRIDRLFTPIWKYIKRISESFDVTIAAGEWLEDRLLDFNIKNPISIPFGIDKNQFSACKGDLKIRTELLAKCGLPADAPLVISVSRFHPEKRLKVLMQAVKQINKQEKQVGLVIFGDGLFANHLKKYGERIAGVHCVGYTNDIDYIAAAYASSDLFLHGSAAETYGLSVAEAICSGLPIVVPDVGGASDFLKYNNGRLYETGDAASCAQAIDEVLNTPRFYWEDGILAQAVNIQSKEEHFDNLFRRYAALSVDIKSSKNTLASIASARVAIPIAI